LRNLGREQFSASIVGFIRKISFSREREKVKGLNCIGLSVKKTYRELLKASRLVLFRAVGHPMISSIVGLERRR